MGQIYELYIKNLLRLTEINLKFTHLKFYNYL